jgi:asparagine synthetase B (glutamine-hydrolysing)
MYLHLVFNRRLKIDNRYRKMLSGGEIINNHLLIDSDGCFVKNNKYVELQLTSGIREQPDQSIAYSSSHNFRYFQLHYDLNSNHISFTSDRFASIQVFYYLTDDILLLSTSFDYLIQMIDDGARAMDKTAASELVDYGYILYGKTLIKGVTRFPYACTMLVTPTNHAINRYWDFTINESIDIPVDAELLKSQLSQKLFSAIEESIPPNADILIPLSGGMDSRLLLAVALEIVESSRITTFTFGQANTQDLEIAQQISKSLELRHIIHNVSSEKSLRLSEKDWNQSYLENIDLHNGSIDATPFAASIDVYRDLRLHGNYLLNGYMGDPLFGSHLSADMLIQIKTVPNPLEKVLEQNKNNPIVNILSEHKIGKPPAILQEALAKYDTFAGYSMHWDYAIRQQDYIKFGQISKFTNIFNVITPFLEPRLLDFACNQIPLRQKLNETLYRQANINTYPNLFKDFAMTNMGGMRVGSKSWERQFSRIKQKVNRVTRSSIFNVPQKLNYWNYQLVSKYQKEYRHFLLSNCSELNDNNIINRDMFEMLNRDIHKQLELSSVLGRLSTLNLSIKKYHISV